MTEVVISSAVLTAIGSHDRSVHDVPPTGLGAVPGRLALFREQVEPEQVEHVASADAIHTEPADPSRARVASMSAGVPRETLCVGGGRGIALASEAA